MADIETAARDLMRAYQDAVASKQVDALMRLYHPQVRVFDAWGVWAYEGGDPWRVAVQGWFASLGDERATVAFEDTHIQAHADSALLTSIVTYAGFSAQGEPLRSMQNRISWGLAWDGTALKIMHEHTSAPIGFEDGKGILQRVPSSAS